MDGMIDVIGTLKAYERGIFSASAQTSRKGRSSPSGCLGLREAKASGRLDVYTQVRQRSDR